MSQMQSARRVQECLRQNPLLASPWTFQRYLKKFYFWNLQYLMLNEKYSGCHFHYLLTDQQRMDALGHDCTNPASQKKRDNIVSYKNMFVSNYSHHFGHHHHCLNACYTPITVTPIGNFLYARRFIQRT